MSLGSGLESVLSNLRSGVPAQVIVGNSMICIFVSENHDSISFSSQVYFGGNYIPRSVRNCISEKPRFDHISLNTFLTVDEEEYKVFLNCKTKLNGINSNKFVLLLENFSFLADEWRLLLDENDKNDLIHIRKK